MKPSLLAHFRWSSTISALSVALLIAPGLNDSAHADDRAKEIREFTGAPTKVVWIQDAGDSACVFSERPTLKLMGFDTEDGKGEHPIVPDIARYWRPAITADGSKVLFGDKDKLIVYVVNWDGTGLRPVVENALFEDTWTDPKDGTVWIYAKVKEKRDDKEIEVIRRYRLDKPEVSELVWDKMPIFQFMVSGDGRAAAGGGDGGNSPQGMLTLPNGTFNARAGGCWPSMSPDNSHRMWVFTGNHRSIHMCIPTNRSGNAYSFPVRFDEAPGITLTGREEMYHPRWSNNVHFLTATSPLSEWSYQAEAKIPNEVAAKVEAYLGKFNEDLTGVEKWVAVTSNDRGDYWPRAWIQPSKEALAAAAASSEVPPEVAPPELDKKGLVFVWENGTAGNQIDDPKTGAIRQCTAQFRDAARLGLHAVLQLTDGAFIPDNAAGPLLTDCKASNQFAFEATLTPTAPSSSEKVILAFADDLATGNVVLTQQENQVSLALKTDANPPTAIPLVQLIPNEPNHLIVSYAPGKLAVFVNGKRAIIPNTLSGNLAQWTAQPLILGDAWKGGHNWPGTMENIGFFSREIGAVEAKQRYAKQTEAFAARKPADKIVVEATLSGRCPAADPAGIAPYRRCLSVQKYDVTKVVEGKLEAKTITVAQWSVLDGKVVPAYEKMAEGQTYQLTLEPWEQHPEQESERLISGDFDASLDLFYDVTAKAVAAPSVVAQTAEWRGFNNDPNAGGDWNATKPSIPWTTPTAPGAGDTAVLPSVTKGTREITNSQPVSLRELQIQQSGKDSVNRFKLGAPLTLAGNEQPLALTAGTELNLNGQDFTIVNDTIKALPLNGTVRMGGANAVTAAVVLDGGFDYTEAPKVTLTGGGGTGAVAEATMSVAALESTILGSGYTAEPTVTISEPDIAGGRRATARAIINKAGGAIDRLLVLDGGSGYVHSPMVTLTGGGGTGAEVEPALAVSAVIVTSGGKGYTQPPAISFEGGNGQQARAQAALQLTLLRYTGDGGSAFVSNEGTLDQDGAALVFDWAAAKNNTGKRGILNNGTWTLHHGAAIQYLSSTGRDNWAGGDNVNAGTMRVIEGSSLGVSRFENKGQLELGAGALIGHVKYSASDNEFINFEKGVVKVLGATREQPAIFGALNAEMNRKRTISNGRANGTDTAQFVIGDGKDASTFLVQGGDVFFDNRAGSSTDIQAGAMLALITNDAGSRHRFETRNAKLHNFGELRLAGKLQVQGNHAGFVGVENQGTLTLSGDTATIERLPSSTGPGAGYRLEMNPSQIANRAEGVIQGSGKLTHLNLTEAAEVAPLQVGNAGTLAPGTEKTLGRLAFANADVVMSGTLKIKLAGPGTDVTKFDAVTLSGDNGAGKWKFANATSVLNLVPADGLTPKGKYRIVTATAVEGSFGTLQLKGQPSTAYKVDYLPDGIEVTFP